MRCSFLFAKCLLFLELLASLHHKTRIYYEVAPESVMQPEFLALSHRRPTMAQSLSPLHRQIARVSRRLFLQTLLACLLWCWAGSLVVVAGWFFLQPHLFPALSPAWR